jgi:hypothetical protein
MFARWPPGGVRGPARKDLVQVAVKQLLRVWHALNPLVVIRPRSGTASSTAWASDTSPPPRPRPSSVADLSSYVSLSIYELATCVPSGSRPNGRPDSVKIRAAAHMRRAWAADMPVASGSRDAATSMWPVRLQDACLAMRSFADQDDRLAARPAAGPEEKAGDICELDCRDRRRRIAPGDDRVRQACEEFGRHA